MKQHYDYIIVGQGLAGSMLAFELMKRNKSLLIIDETSGATASRQATGIINPVTGRKFVKSWMADTLIPFAIEKYSELGSLFQKELFKHTSILKIIANVEQLNDIEAKIGSDGYSAYLDSAIKKCDENIFHNPYGSIRIHHVLQINIALLLDCMLEMFIKKEVLVKEIFDFEKLTISSGKVEYKNIEADRIIFCEGYLGKSNPFFSYLPLQSTKGEALIIEAPMLPQDSIVGGVCNITPIGNQRFYAGATYAWGDYNPAPTTAKKDELTKKISETLSCSFKVLEHKAGIRPAVSDRRPLAGTHPEHSHLFIFNGFGTKGLSLAPYFACEFAGFLEGQQSLHPEIDIKRFEKKHYAKT
jgi:glycine oxidase